MLQDISSKNYEQKHMFVKNNPIIDNLMERVDLLNSNLGKNSVFHASQGIKKEWKMKRRSLSPCYTTNWKTLPLVR